MKANVKTIGPDTVIVRGVELKFNAFDERYLQKWQKVGAEVEAKYPGAMDLGVDMAAVANLPEGANIADKFAEGTAAFCELYDGVFGEGTSAKLFGNDPYYGVCLEAYYEFLGAIEKQGQRYGQRVSKNLANIVPLGPKGKK